MFMGEGKGAAIKVDFSMLDPEAFRTLPDEWRTAHWYNDLQHSMFLILFADLFDALRRGRQPLAEYYIDTITVYWLIHSLTEEEGMAHSAEKGLLTASKVDCHARAHMAITRQWERAVFVPFKDGASLPHILAKAQVCYRAILRHIQEDDCQSYGQGAGWSDGHCLDEVSHLASTGLPLSPLMPGCQEMATMLAPNMARRIAHHNFASQSRAPLRPLRLSPADAASGSLRERLLSSRPGRRAHRAV